MAKSLSIGAILLGVIVGTQHAAAYMTPTEVFPDIVVPEEEAEEAVASSTISNSVQSSSVSSEQSSSSIRSVRPHVPVQTISTSSRADGKPTFYRSGEQLELQEQSESAPEEETIFNESASEVSSAAPIEEMNDMPEESEVLPEEPLTEAVEKDEPEKPAAPEAPANFGIFGAMKYIISITGLLVTGIAFALMAKKKLMPARSQVTEQSVVTPATTELNDSSERVEQALAKLSDTTENQ